MRKKQHGGKRKGAGRPASVAADQSLNIRIDAETMQKLEQLTQWYKCSKSEVVRGAILVQWEMKKGDVSLSMAK